MSLEIAEVVAPSRAAGGDDRVLVITHAKGTSLILADGAGGTGRGGDAASFLVDFLHDALRTECGIEDPVATLRQADDAIRHRKNGGQTTGLLVTIDGSSLSGASVGDSEAWFIGEHLVVLTEGQRRRPLLGTGEAMPVGFAKPRLPGMLVLASDGLFGYASAAKIVDAVRGLAPTEAAAALVALVRFPSGALQDDVAVITAAITAPSTRPAPDPDRSSG